jgi:hypothetical protein
MANLLSSATGPSNIDDIFTTTLQKISPEITDNKFQDFPILSWFRRNGLNVVDGGSFIEERLEYDSNATVGFFGDYQVLETNPNQILTAAFFPPRSAACSISISAQDEAKNNGIPAISSLLQARTKNAMKSLELLINQALFEAAPGTIDPWSLAEIVDSADPSRANLGGIDRDTYSWWSANETAMTSFAAAGVSNMNTMRRDCASGHGNNEPDFIISTPTVFGFYENSLDPKVRYTDTEMANAGFTNLKNGMATVTYDADCNSGVMYFLNSKYIKFSVYSKFNFTTTPFVKPANQVARTAQIVAIFNITSSQPRRLGKLTGIVA